MKRTTLIFILAMLSQIAIAGTDASENTGDGTSIPIGKKDPIPTGGRLKAPSRQQIHCTYLDGVIYLSFDLNEGLCNLTVTDTINGDSNAFAFSSTTESAIYVGEIINTSLLTITTENGNTYEGIIY